MTEHGVVELRERTDLLALYGGTFAVHQENLVDILGLTAEVMSYVSQIGRFEQHSFQHSPLDCEVPLLQVWCAMVRLDEIKAREPEKSRLVLNRKRRQGLAGDKPACRS